MDQGFPRAVEQVGHEVLARRRLRGLSRRRARKTALDRKAHRVDRVDHARFEDRHQDPREGRIHHCSPQPSEIFSSALACWSCPPLIVSGTRPVDAGVEERLRRTESAEVTTNIQISMTSREQRDGYRRLHSGLDRIAGEHHESSRRWSAQTPPTTMKLGAGERERRGDQAELGSAAADLNHRKRQRRGG